MVSIISMIVNLILRRPIQIRRLPPRKVLRAHLSGITLAFLVVLVMVANSVLHHSPIDFAGSWTIPTVLVIIFALGSLFGGWFVIVAALFTILADSSSSFGGHLDILSHGYVLGYLFGGIFATLYNDLVFLHLVTVRRDLVKIAFAFDPNKIVNVIKSPIEGEITAPVDRERRLYDYEINHPPAHPYTIAFIANPYVLHRDDSLKKDPIIDNLDLFLSSVDRALFSFESNEVLGRPEIWSRVRVVVIFDPHLADRGDIDLTMLQASRDGVTIDGEAAENMIDPREEMNRIYVSILNSGSVRSQHTDELLDTLLNETDVIFAMSASADYDRSTAHFADWIESADSDPQRNRAGIDFTYNSDPNPENRKSRELGGGITVSEINADICHPANAVPPPGEVFRFTCRHEFYSCFPGRVALNVLGASLKTYIHEFGHAMSCAFHGAIVDEYADTFEVEDVETVAEEPPPKPFYVNRIDRNVEKIQGLIPVHRVFAKYNGVEYLSDLYHPSAEEEWVGYFPERESPLGTCSMDRSYSIHQFDKLIGAFMYDRLVTKINRPKRSEDECEAAS